MLRQRTLAVFAAIATALTLSAAPAAAQATAALRGTFTLNSSASDNVHAAIDATVRRMNFVTRPVARGRLRNTNAPYQRVQLSWDASNVTVNIDQRAAIVSPADGSVIKWRREDNETLDLSTRWANGALTQRFAAEDGTRENVYSISPDGNTMTMNVTVTSPRLPAPLRYKLVYNRAN